MVLEVLLEFRMCSKNGVIAPSCTAVLVVLALFLGSFKDTRCYPTLKKTSKCSTRVRSVPVIETAFSWKKKEYGREKKTTTQITSFRRSFWFRRCAYERMTGRIIKYGWYRYLKRLRSVDLRPIIKGNCPSPSSTPVSQRPRILRAQSEREDVRKRFPSKNKTINEKFRHKVDETFVCFPTQGRSVWRSYEISWVVIVKKRESEKHKEFHNFPY